MTVLLVHSVPVQVVTFVLRPNMTFHSGNPVTAEDAAFSIQRVIKLNLTPAQNVVMMLGGVAYPQLVVIARTPSCWSSRAP